MTKLNTIKKLVWKPEIQNIPKYLAFVGILYSAVSPILPTSAGAAIISERPALFALADTQPFLFSQSGQSLPQPSNLMLVNGSALAAQNSFAPDQKTVKQEKNEKITVDRKYNVIVTAYSSTPDQTDSSPFITASGSYVEDGIVACNFLKFGTKIRFPEVYGDKIFVVEDRMAKYNSHKVDIWMAGRQQALEFGVKHLTLEILD